MDKFLCEYDHEGEKWGLTIHAKDWADAEQKLKAIGYGSVLGSHVTELPAYACNWLVARLLVRYRNWVASQ